TATAAPAIRAVRRGCLSGRRCPAASHATDVGWANAGTGVASEAEAAEAALAEWRLPLRWRDAQSRDTAENARHMKALLARDGVTRIALVTHAWHLPRAIHHFEAQGLTVVAAPTAFILPHPHPLHDWLPGSGGLTDSRAVLREWLALQLL
ncbi:MAG: YdcF family protein, partial [Rubrivivax sp.]